MNETYDKTTRESHFPEVWPGWETVEELGKGSFGAVYKIRRQTMSFEEHAAVKCISIPKDTSEITDLRKNGYDDDSITENFREQSEKLLREYALMRSLNGNTNIVNCDDVRSVPHADGFGMDLYIKMELLTPLDSLEQSRFHEEEITRLGIDLCAALALCEKKNIIHRDIKPANIFVSENGDYKLGDFGVSRFMESTSTNGGITGTPRYMAPEVYANRKYGHTADIYSLGLVLYWLLNERRTPFQPLPPAKLSYSVDQEAMNRRLSGEEIPEPKNGREALKKIVLKALAYDPGERYQSAEEIKGALMNMESPNPAPKEGPEPEPKPEPKLIPEHGPAPKQEPSNPEPKKPLWLLVLIPLLLLGAYFALRGKSDSVSAPTSTPAPTPEIHVHSWAEATCTRPAKCTICGETQGTALGHSWTPATCTAPKTCGVCGATEGSPAGHSWAEATCTSPECCHSCGETRGTALGHNWIPATRTDPKTCSRCGTTEGLPVSGPGPDDMNGCDSRIVWPDSWENSYSTVYVDGFSDIRIYVLDRPGGDNNNIIGYANEKMALKVLAKQNGYSLCAQNDVCIGWCSSKYLVSEYQNVNKR